jgi:hypothetical protein
VGGGEVLVDAFSCENRIATKAKLTANTAMRFIHIEKPPSWGYTSLQFVI